MSRHRKLRPSPQRDALLRFLCAYIARYKTTPKYAEMAAALDIASNGPIGNYLRRLEELGYIVRTPGEWPSRNRAQITITEKGFIRGIAA